MYTLTCRRQGLDPPCSLGKDACSEREEEEGREEGSLMELGHRRGLYDVCCGQTVNVANVRKNVQRSTDSITVLYRMEQEGINK